jgi:DNA-binding transcriptional ArsR family regulator
MRLLYHPAPSAITLQGILYALADPLRAQMFIEIENAADAKSCSELLGAGSKLSKSTLSGHCRLLRESGLVRVERHGTALLNYSRSDEIEQLFPGLLTAFKEAYKRQWRQPAATR